MNRGTPWELFRSVGLWGREGLFSALIITALLSPSNLVTVAQAAPPGLSDTYQKMVEADPYDAYALRRLLEVNKAPGSLKRLLVRYTERVKARPDDRVAWALVGHLLRASDQPVKAVEAFGELSKLTPTDPRPQKAIAQVWRQARRWEPMVRAYDAALALVRKREAKIALYEEAIEAALEAERSEEALRWITAYRAVDDKRVSIAMSCADLLTRFGKTQEAIGAWRQAEEHKRAQLADQVVIWRHLGSLLEESGQVEEAEVVWRRAIKSTPASHWSRPLFIEGLARVHRRTDRLPELVEELKARARQEPALRGPLAGIYEELGQPEAALRWLKEALKVSRRDASLHERRIEILRRRDDLPALDAAYRELIRAAPREARYGLDYAEELFRRGHVSRGLKGLDRVTRASRRDPGVWQRAISMMITYARGASVTRIREGFGRLIQLEPREPAHHIGLGEHLWESGDPEGAKRAWRKLRKLGRASGAGDLLYAEVLADHRLHEEARVAFEAALAAGPENVACLEAAARWYAAQAAASDREQAMKLWLRLLELGRDAKTNPRAAARRHGARKQLLLLWKRSGVLNARLKELASRTAGAKPDLSAGLLLSHLRLHLGRLEEAQRGVADLAKRFPDHLELLHLQVDLAVKAQELPRAIALLRKIATLDSSGASDALHQAAQLAKAIEDHETALELMESALTLRPEDPRGQARVGELRLGLGDRERAASAWREALRMNPRDDDLRLKLAGLYRELADTVREERLLVELVRDGSSGGHVQRAGRRLLNLAASTDRLSVIERVLRPLALAQGRRAPVHRRLLVDLYLKQAQALSWELARTPDTQAHLDKLGSRALEVLLAALQGTDAALRARALEVLRLTRPVGVVPALARILEHGDGMSRLHAAVILGFIGSDSSAEPLIRALDDTRPLREVGPAVRSLRELQYNVIWSLGRVGGTAAREKLLALTGAEHATHHPMVALALAHYPHADTVRVLSQLAGRQGIRTRQAALWALAHMDRDEAVPPLAQALRSTLAGESEIALWALGRSSSEAARRVLFDAFVTGVGPAPHLLVRVLASRASGAPPPERFEPYTRLIDLNQLRLASGAPDPAALISATVLSAQWVATRESSEAFLQRLDQRYLRAGRVDDRQLARHALGALTGRPGLSLPETWRLTGLTKEERAEWALRLAGRLRPILERSLVPGPQTPESRRAIALLAHLLAAEPDSDLQVALHDALDRALGGAEGEALAELWRSAARLKATLLERLVKTHGPAERPAAYESGSAGALVAFAAAAGRCSRAQAEGALEPLLRSPSTRVRIAAVQSVSATHPGLVSPLTDLLEDPSVEVARQAAQALRRLGGPKAAAALQVIETSGDPRSLLDRSLP